ncbi:MAG: hypothetical protein JO246_16240 [Frankiaceae bacterium]|nr:hypothetical protein [Frankiaceae bacterium]MBV9870122.1 hypothetical protein [Frankiaceae bacterium]
MPFPAPEPSVPIVSEPVRSDPKGPLNLRPWDAVHCDETSVPRGLAVLRAKWRIAAAMFGLSGMACACTSQGSAVKAPPVTEQAGLLTPADLGPAGEWMLIAGGQHLDEGCISRIWPTFPPDHRQSIGLDQPSGKTAASIEETFIPFASATALRVVREYRALVLTGCEDVPSARRERLRHLTGGVVASSYSLPPGQLTVVTSANPSGAEPRRKVWTVLAPVPRGMLWLTVDGSSRGVASSRIVHRIVGTAVRKGAALGR